ncbi:hypothetical protein [Citricoccus sp. K5]|uniref:hypothetical protein n=1 Tax=Citricoccus sp. K5 TaxID=2653135 RepID=UPI0012F2DE25|nr:hypothetical protein [Citricoccus sp. K5]VXB92942.1 hypothetical protein CITRIK5_70258 [Citricoccus sp. K5]
MNFKDLANKAQSFASSPRGRKMINQATDAVRRRGGGKASGAGHSSGLNRVLDAARRFTDGRGGHPGDPSRGSGPQPPRH